MGVFARSWLFWPVIGLGFMAMVLAAGAKADPDTSVNNTYAPDLLRALRAQHIAGTDDTLVTQCHQIAWDIQNNVRGPDEEAAFLASLNPTGLLPGQASTEVEIAIHYFDHQKTEDYVS